MTIKTPYSIIFTIIAFFITVFFLTLNTFGATLSGPDNGLWSCNGVNLSVRENGNLIYSGRCPMPPLFIDDKSEVEIAAEIAGEFSPDAMPAVEIGQLWLSDGYHNVQLFGGIPHIEGFQYNRPLVLKFKTDKAFSEKFCPARISGPDGYFCFDDTFSVNINKDGYEMETVISSSVSPCINQDIVLPEDTPITVKAGKAVSYGNEKAAGHLSPVNIYYDNEIATITHYGIDLDSWFDSPFTFTQTIVKKQELSGILEAADDNMHFSLRGSQKAANIEVYGDSSVLTYDGWRLIDANPENIVFRLPVPLDIDIPYPDYYNPLLSLFMPGEHKLAVAVNNLGHLTPIASANYNARDFAGEEASPMTGDKAREFMETGIMKGADYYVRPFDDVLSELDAGEKLNTIDLPISKQESGQEGGVIRRWCDIYAPKFTDFSRKRMTGFFSFSYRDVNLMDVWAGVILKCYQETEQTAQEGNETAVTTVITAVAPPEGVFADFSLNGYSDQPEAKFFSSQRFNLKTGQGAIYTAKGQLTVDPSISFKNQTCSLRFSSFRMPVSLSLNVPGVLNPSPFIVLANGENEASVETVVSPAILSGNTVTINLKTVKPSGECVNPQVYTKAKAEILVKFGQDISNSQDMSFALTPNECGWSKTFNLSELFWDGQVINQAVFSIKTYGPSGEEYPGRYKNLAWTIALPKNGLPIAFTFSVPSVLHLGDLFSMGVKTELIGSWPRPWGYSIKVSVIKFKDGNIYQAWLSGNPVRPIVSWQDAFLASGKKEGVNLVFKTLLPDDFWSFMLTGQFLAAAEVIDEYTGETIFQVSSPVEVLP